MKAILISFFSVLFLLGSSPTFGQIIISEVDADTPGTDTEEFVELNGPANASLDGYVIVFINGSGDASYRCEDLDGFTLDANGFFTLGSLNSADLDLGASNIIQNGADAIALYQVVDCSAVPTCPNGTADLTDAIVYDTNDGDDSGLLTCLGETIQFNESENGNSDMESNQWNGSTYVLGTPTPNAPFGAPPIPCDISNIAISNNGCVFDDFEFDVEFMVTGGSGNYEVFDVGNNLVLETGTVSPITVSILGSVTPTTLTVQIRDVATPTCTSVTATVNIEDCSTNTVTCPAVGDIIISEIMQNPAEVSDANGEYFEVYNTTMAPIDLLGLTIESNSSFSELISQSVVVAAGGYAVLGINADQSTNGGLVVDYEYNSNNGILGNNSDFVQLVCGGTIIDVVAYDGGPNFPDPNGASMNLNPAFFNAIDNDTGANWCESTIPYGDGDLGTPGSANEVCSTDCSISLDFLSGAGCNGNDFEINVNFSVSNGTGPYEVVDDATNLPIATSTVSPIQLTFPNSVTQTVDIFVRDAGAPTCTSATATVFVEDCSNIPTSTCPNAGDLVITEIMQNPDMVGDSQGEYFEVYNSTGADIDLVGFILKDDGSDLHTINASVIVPAGGYAILGREDDMSINGGVSVDYEYASFSLSNSVDEIILECEGTLIDQVFYDNSFPLAAGVAQNLNPNNLNATDNDNGANWCESTSSFGLGDLGTPGTANDACVAPMCMITNAAISNEMCSGTTFTFEVSFTDDNSSGSFEVVEVGGSTLASGTVSPIMVSIPNSATTNTINIQVIDANETACSSTVVPVTLQDCTPIPTCPITLTRSGTETTGTYEASDLVQTSGTTIIGDGEDVVYSAGNQVDLNAEFTVDLGGVFLAEIAGCIPLIGDDIQMMEIIQENHSGTIISTDQLLEVIQVKYIDVKGETIKTILLENSNDQIFIPQNQIPLDTKSYQVSSRSK